MALFEQSFSCSAQYIHFNSDLFIRLIRLVFPSRNFDTNTFPIEYSFVK